MSFVNNVKTTIHSDLNATATSIQIAKSISPFNDPPTSGKLTFMDSLSNPSKIEVVSYTGRTDNSTYWTLTGVTRGLEDTTAASFSVGAYIVQTWTAGQASTASDKSISGTTGLQSALDGKVDDSQVLTNVPSGAVFTDTNTTYSVGDGGLTTNDFTDADHNKLNGIAAGANNYTLPSGLATETYVGTQISNLVDSSPATLNTLNELAAALDDDPNFATTVTNSIATKLPLAGGTLTGDVSHGDNVKAKFGAGDDLSIYHDGSNSYIKETGTGYLTISSGTDLVMESAGGEEFIRAVGNEGVTSFYNGIAKLATTSTGVDVTGNIAVSGTVDGRDVSVDGSKLDGIETGATADQTAAEILTKIKTVDGAGSGLAADLLDGVQGSSYLRSDATDTFTNLTGSSVDLGSGYGTGITFEGNKHQINNNDGGGNFNIRVANDFVTGITEAGYASHWLFTQSSGLWEFRTTTASQSVGTAPAWQVPMSISKGGNIGVLGTVDGRNIAADGLKLNTIETGATADQTTGQIKAHLVNGIDSTHYVDGSIDRVHLANDVIDSTKIANDSVNSEHYVSDSIDAVHLNVSGNGTTSQYLRSDGDGSMSWVTPPNTTYTATQMLDAVKTVDGSGSGLDADTVDGIQGSTIVTAPTHLSGNLTSNNWYTVATFSGSRSKATVTVSDTTSSRHGWVKLEVVWSYGNGGITLVQSGKHGTHVMQQARLLYNSGDQTYGGGKLQIYCGNTASNLIVKQIVIPETTGWGNAILVTPGSESGTPSGWTQYTAIPIGGNGQLSTSGDLNVGGNAYVGSGAVWHSANDGSGSGLDADLLDGLQASQFLRSDTEDTMTSQLTFSGSSPQIKFNDTDADDFWIHANSNNFYVLTDRDDNGSWEGANPLLLQNSDSQAYVYGQKVWNQGNDGSGSGLDADLLDGQQGSSYLRSNADDIMTGSLTIDVDNKANGALRITANQTNPNNDLYFAQEIISTLSGSTATTGDREQGGIYMDINSTATGGDTSNEHRVYGAYIDVDSTGDADVVYGVYADATVTPSTGANTLCVGGNFRAEDNGGAGTVSNVYGVYGQAYSDNGTSDTGNLVGGYFKTSNAVDTGAITYATGVYGEIEILANTPDKYGTSYVFQAQYDNNSTVAQTNTTYLYYGNYAGVLPTTAYGVYINDTVPNVFLGTLRLGDGSTTAASYGFDGDVNTGMYSPADHELGFLANGAQRLKLNSLGAEITGVLNLRATANGSSCLINFSDNLPSAGQNGTIQYIHSDSGSYGAGNTFKVYGTEPSMSFHVAGSGLFTGNVTAYYSDERLKDFEGVIDNALDKVKSLNGYYYKGNATAGEFGYDTEERQIGVSAQEVEAVLPEAVKPAPIDPEYKTVQYERLVPLLIEAIKEQQVQIDELKELIKCQ